MTVASQRVIKRSLVIAGHATSISLEEEFWQALRHALSISALRVFCLREALRIRA